MLVEGVTLTKYDPGYECEMLRVNNNETIVTKIAFEELEDNEENLRAPVEELDTNKLGKSEVQLVEERKALARLRIESRDGLPSI